MSSAVCGKRAPSTLANRLWAKRKGAVQGKKSTVRQYTLSLRPAPFPPSPDAIPAPPRPPSVREVQTSRPCFPLRRCRLAGLQNGHPQPGHRLRFSKARPGFPDEPMPIIVTPSVPPAHPFPRTCSIRSPRLTSPPLTSSDPRNDFRIWFNRHRASHASQTSTFSPTAFCARFLLSGPIARWRPKESASLNTLQLSEHCSRTSSRGPQMTHSRPRRDKTFCSPGLS